MSPQNINKAGRSIPNGFFYVTNYVNLYRIE